MFHYYIPPAGPAHDDAAVAEIPGGITTVEDLADVLADALAFPGYCGRNFDAIWDCIRDLEAVDARQIVLYHHDLPALPHPEIGVYIELLRDAVIFWEDQPEHQLEVWFPSMAREEIDSLMTELPPPEPYD